MKENMQKKIAEIILSKNYAENILWSMPGNLIVITPKGLIKFVNKAALDLLEYSANELTGEEASLIFTKEEKAGLRKFFGGSWVKNLTQDGASGNFETVCRSKRGRKIPVSFFWSAICEFDKPGVLQPAPFGGKVVGLAGELFDLRRAYALAESLKTGKALLENNVLSPEKKNENRSKDLIKSQQAPLYLMEDIQNAKDGLEKKTMELEKAKEQLEVFSKGLDEMVKKRTKELTILYDVSTAVSCVQDNQALLELVMEALFKIAKYDICGSLIFGEDAASITLKPVFSESVKFADEVKIGLIDSASSFAGEEIRKKKIKSFFLPSGLSSEIKNNRQVDKLRSFFNVPFMVCGRAVGVINVSSCSDSAFNEDEKKLMITVVNQASSVIQRLRSVVTVEKSKMQSMVENMFEGIIMIIESEDILILNSQSRCILGFNQADNVSLSQLVEKLNAIGLYDAIQECQLKVKGIMKEIALVHGGKSMVLSCNISSVKGFSGEAAGVVVVLRDITREKEIDKMKTEFVSTVSHELRTPLTTIKEFVSIISDGIPGSLTIKQKEYIDIVKNNADRLSRLISDLLDISRIESGNLELRLTFVNLVDLVKIAVSSLKPQAEIKRVEFKVFFPSAIVNVYADPDKLIQILINLISNAVKFSKESGKVTLMIRSMDKEIECSVSDEGIGIAAENFSKLFVKFQQFSRTSGAGSRGTGLGLAIVKDLVEAHQGTIRVESEIDKGSRFIFTLPKYTSEDVFRKYIEKEFKKAKLENNALSVLVMHIKVPAELKRKFASQNARKIFRDMETIVKNSVQCDSVFIHEEGSIVIIFKEAGRKKVLLEKEKIENFVKKYKFKTSGGRFLETHVTFGIATYPEEDITEEELFFNADAVAGSKTKGKTILIVDDEEVMVDLTEECLKTDGYEILKAYNGKEALKVMRIKIPDLVIADMNMPFLDGPGLLREMKKDASLAEVPFMFLSGTKKEFEDRVEGIVNGAIWYFIKPYDVEEFLKAVRSILKNKI